MGHGGGIPVTPLLTHLHFFGVMHILGGEEAFPGILLIGLQLEPRFQQFHALGVELPHPLHPVAGTVTHGTASHAGTVSTHHRTIAHAAAAHRAMSTPRTRQGNSGQTYTGDNRGG